MNILLSFVIGASAFTTTHDAALQAYRNENFPEAIERFEELVYNRVYEPEVFYNLANAYYRTGYLAPAIANYERAILLDPSLEAAEDNLNRTVGRTLRGLPKPAITGVESSFYFWHGNLNKKSSMTIAFVFWILGWAVLAVRTLKPRPYMRRVSVAFLLIGLVFFGSWNLKANPASLAVANGNKIPVRYGTDTSDTLRFELFEGDRVHIDQQNDEWVRVVTADGKRGWTREEYLIKVWPPNDESQKQIHQLNLNQTKSTDI